MLPSNRHFAEGIIPWLIKTLSYPSRQKTRVFHLRCSFFSNEGVLNTINDKMRYYLLNISDRCRCDAKRTSSWIIPRNTPTTKKQTPYTIHMRENYVTLKWQCKDDKKAIFTKCYEMWENESQDVKSMYERMAKEENGESGNLSLSDTVLTWRKDILRVGPPVVIAPMWTIQHHVAPPP
jgi:hypothetical protein